MIEKLPAATLRPASRPHVQAQPPALNEPCETFAPKIPGEPAWGQSLTGDIRYHQVESKILDNSRGVWVYLPPGYHDHPDKDYPVIYMNDGQNVFESGTAFGGQEWRADEAAEALIRGGKMQDTIIVAVSNAGRARMDEYTQVADANSSPDPDHLGGKADEYGKFLIQELKPMIDSRYRTEQKAESTAIMGSSLGGLVALHLAFNNPNVFGVCGAISPSIWWASRDILDKIAALPEGQGPSRVWLDMGTKEAQADKDNNGVPDTIDDIRATRDLLEKRGYQVGKNLIYWEVPGGTHSEGSWSEVIPVTYVSLFPRRGFTVTGPA